LAAGNAVVLKPFDISPATSPLLRKLFEEYPDTSAIRVVEGTVTDTTPLLEQKQDNIFYTSSTLEHFIF
jgi:aldehyde dehydrogenase (NAD+)